MGRKGYERGEEEGFNLKEDRERELEAQGQYLD